MTSSTCTATTRIRVSTGSGLRSTWRADVGQTSLASTNHGSVRGLCDHHAACEKHGLKAIHGIEAYLVDDATLRGLDADEKRFIEQNAANRDEAKEAKKEAQRLRMDRDHITIWAMDREGLRNLFRLSSWSWNEGYYFKPRLDFERLREFSAGLAISTGCPGGVVTSPLRRGDFRTAIDRTTQLADVFGDRLYVEIMPHVLHGAERLNEHLIKLAARFDLKLLATQDSHYPTREEAKAQEALLCINTRDKMSNPPASHDYPHGRFCFDSTNYWLRSRAEMETAWEATKLPISKTTIRAALDETMLFAERCTARLEFAKKGQYLVSPPLPEGVPDHDAWLRRLCAKGIRTRYRTDLASWPDVYKDRLIKELDLLRDLGFAPYFCAVWDIATWARSQGILLGPGRGSVGGSLVAYLIGLHDVDPIVHGLVLERFLSRERTSLPDIDTDIEKGRGEEVVNELERRYGTDRIAGITTSMAFRGKMVLQSLGRIHELPGQDVLAVTSLITEGQDQETLAEGTIAQVLDTTAPGQAFEERYPDVAQVARQLEGQLRTVGTHPAGLIVSSELIRDLVPLESRPRPGTKDGRMPVVAFDMHVVEKFGLVKLDLLRLNVLRQIASAVRLIPGGVDFDILDRADDPRVYEHVLSAGRFTGIFQFDTPSARRLCNGVRLDCLADVATMTALNRPGPMGSGLADQYVLRKRGEPFERPHPIVWECTSDTFGVIVYQEQIMEGARRYAGYSADEVNGFRDAVAKKKGLSEHHDRFISGAVTTANVEEADAEVLWDSLVSFASYAFNKSHSYEYGLLAYWCAWLKHHHPAEFWTGMLSWEEERQKQIAFSFDARQSGQTVLPPDVNASGTTFRLVDGAIVGSLSEVHGVGPKASSLIEQCGPYTSLVDFREKTSKAGRGVHRGVFTALVKATAFRRLFPHTKALVESAETIWDALGNGLEPRFDVPPQEYDADALVEIASSVYPIYVSETGDTAIDVAYRRLCGEASRPLVLPHPFAQHFEVVVGHVVLVKLSRDEARSAGVVLIGPDGTDLPCRASQGVLVRCSDVLAKAGRRVVACVVNSRGRYSIVHAFDATTFDPKDGIVQAVLNPKRTRPADPHAVLARLPEDTTGRVEGVLLTKSVKRDKNGRPYAILGLLGSRGFVDVFVFSECWKQSPRKGLEIGSFVRASAKCSGNRLKGSIFVASAPVAMA